MKLTKEQIIKIIDDKSIDECSEDERQQVMDFMFGEEFMDSDDKGEKKLYEDDDS